MISSILKWMFGSWSLERKCLFFLALALLVSLFIAFAAVQSVAEQLVMESARHSAREYANSYLGWRHVSSLYEHGRTGDYGGDLLPAQENPNGSTIRPLGDDIDEDELDEVVAGRIRNPNPSSSAALQPLGEVSAISEDLRVLMMMRDDMFQVNHEMVLFRLDDQLDHESLRAQIAEGADLAHLQSIYAKLLERDSTTTSSSGHINGGSANVSNSSRGLASEGSDNAGVSGHPELDLGVPSGSPKSTTSVAPAPEIGTPESQQTTMSTPSSSFIFEEAGPFDGYYYYYQPVLFKSECRVCHGELPAAPGALTNSAGNRYANALGSIGAEPSLSVSPFRVYRIKLPYSYTRFWSLWSYSVLTSIAILTLALSLFFVHWILKRLVIRPLVYMKEVSEGITAGDTSLRFHLETQDEFHDLSESFNAMLRHLTTTQSELEAVNDKMNTQVDELARVNLELFEANRLKGEFLANMSHELRTPLNSILGFSDVLQGVETLTDKQRRYVSNIQNSGRNLLEMINDILDLAKVEAGKMQVRPTEFDIIRIIHSQCDLIRKMADDKNIDIRLDSSHDSLLIVQDQTKVQQILTNLLSNAVKFTPEGGLITVQCDPRAGNDLVIAVADTGVGIAIEDHEIIFEKFRQAKRVTGLDGLTREHSGTGLGLSIVKELCRLLGGEIGVASQVGFGSTFRVRLPMRYEKPEESADSEVSIAR